MNFVPLDREPQASDWRQTLEFPSFDDYFTRTLMVTPLDSAGNEGISTTFEIVFDNSAAALTATQVVTYISLLDTVAPVEVLTGAISDDTGVAVLEATLQDPEGLIQITDLPIVGESWSYSTLPTIAGTYQIWLIAVDEVGNAADLGPYLVQVNEPSVSLAVWPNENVTLGGVVTYTLAITNPNPFNAVTAAITDPLPVLLGNPVVVNGSATIVGEAIQWNPAVSPQSTVTTSFTAVVTQGHAYFDVEAINSAAFSIDTFSGTITGMVKASFGTQGETLIFVQDTVYSRLAPQIRQFLPDAARSSLAVSAIPQTGRAAWGDYDNDGDLDLLLTGAVSDTISALYRNAGGAFIRETTMDSSLTGVRYSSAAWGDYDNDGDLDILLTDQSAGGDVAHVYENTGSAFIQDTAANLPGVSQGSGAWGDYDNDGDLDILLTGSGIAGVYENTGIAFVENTEIDLTGVSRASAAWGDYDNDDDMDILLAGDTGTERVTQLYENTGDGFVQDTWANLPGVHLGNVAWGDYDNDGDLDILLTGCTFEMALCDTGELLARVYQNNEGRLDFYDHLLTGIHEGGAAWGDYDNDGDMDILLVGAASGGNVARVYRNIGDKFTTSPAAVLSDTVYVGSSWADYDNDGDMDILLSGTGSTFYRNDRNNANTRPNTPDGLTASVDGAYITLNWDAASDAQTPAGGLSYNVAVGTSPGATDVVAPMALTGIVSGGIRLLPAIGNAQHNLTATLVITQLDTYYWRVQAIDTAFAGSTWSAETTFEVVSYPDLQVEKAASSIYPKPGGPLTYTLRFANVGALTATNVTLVDSISQDSGLVVSQIVSHGISITHVAATTYTWQIADLAPGAGGVITISGVVSPDLPVGTIIGNSAIIAATDDGYLLNNDDTVDVTVSNPLSNLTIVVTGTGSGTVTPTVGTHTYTQGEVVTLTATPDANSGFVGWSGDLTGTVNPDTITMTRDMTVTATFDLLPTVPTYTLNVTISPMEGGTVTPNPPGPVYAENTPVELTANVADGYEFVGWSGDLTGTVNPDTITMTRDMTVTATFDLLTYTLTITTTGDGTGTVDLVPAGGVYNHGDSVTLTAEPALDSYFGGWTGDLLSANNPDTLVMDEDKQVTVTFTTEPPVTYTLTVHTAGSGTVDPASGTYISGTAVILTATPDPGWQFGGWSGDVISTSNPLSITMTGNVDVTATFKQDEFDIYLPLVVRDW